MKNVLILLGMAWFCLFAQAQNLKIVNTEAENDSVTVEIAVKASELKSTDLILTEAGEKKEFSFNAGEKNLGTGQTADKKHFCFLIETTGFTAPQALSNFKSALKQIIPQISDQDKVAILTFNQADGDQKVIKHIIGFTDNKAECMAQLDKVIAKQDSNAKADIFKAIYDATGWISDQNVGSSVQLIVLTAGINHSFSKIKRQEASEKAQKLKIPVFSLVHKTWMPYSGDEFQVLADDTDGQSAIVGKSAEAIDKLKAQMNLEAKTGSADEYTYFLHFATDASSGETKKFEIEYAGEKYNGEYTILTTVDKTSFFQQNLFLIIGLAGLILIILAILLLRKKPEAKPIQTNIPKMEEPKKNEPEIKKVENVPNPLVPPHSIPQGNLKQTMVTGHQSPALKLHFNNNIQTFPITTAKVSIGRNPGNDIQIDDQTVSGSHAYIQFQEGAFYIFDNQSTNGTFVNQKKITEHKLNPHDQIKLGSAIIEFILI